MDHNHNQISKFIFFPLHKDIFPIQGTHWELFRKYFVAIEKFLFQLLVLHNILQWNYQKPWGGGVGLSSQDLFNLERVTVGSQ